MSKKNQRRGTSKKNKAAYSNLETRTREQISELKRAKRLLSKEIDERRRAEEAVKAEHKRFNDVLETLPVYLVLLTPDYHVPFANRFFRERFGESHGKRCFEYLFGRTEPCEICETYTVLKTMAPHRWEWTGPDGRDYDIYDFPFTDADESTLILEMGIDITERKRVEQELRRHEEHLVEMVKERTAELESRNIQLASEITERKRTEDALREIGKDLNRAQAVAHTGSWRLDVRQDKLLWSDETYRMFGIPRGTPMTYEMFLATVHPEDREYVDTRWTAALSGEPYNIEHRIVVGDTVKWVRERAELDFDSGGELIGGFGTVQDTTEMKDMTMERIRLIKELQRSRDELEIRVQDRTAELQKSAKALEQSNRELENFAHVASHDLQEPLRKIQTFADRLVTIQQDTMDDKARDYLTRMRLAAGRMQALVQDLLTYSRVTSRRTPFKLINLKIPIDEAVRDLMVRFEETGGSIEIDELPEIEADHVQMRQLFENLINNALKYHGEERPVIRVYSSPSFQDEFHEIHVEDNGIGFDELHLDKIFMPFQRLHGKSAPYNGTGMGLAICRRILEHHGGSITARGNPGKGATFIVRLPKKRGAGYGEETE